MAQHHGRRAVAALDAVLFPQRRLHLGERAVGREPFDRGDLRTVRLGREHRASLDRHAVQQDRAGTALAGFAADLRAGQPEVFTEEVDEQPVRRHA